MLILGIDEEEENTEDDDKGYGDGEDDKMKKDGSYECKVLNCPCNFVVILDVVGNYRLMWLMQPRLWLPRPQTP